MTDSQRKVGAWLIEHRIFVMLAVTLVLAVLFVPYFATETSHPKRRETLHGRV